jgi:tRNA nucleotidyltransferase/poly(A) polymerase
MSSNNKPLLFNNVDFSTAKIYEVGGAVRDELINKYYDTNISIKDYDFTVITKSYEDMKQFIINNNFKIFLENPKFFVIRTIIPKQSTNADVDIVGDFVLSRKEKSYSDGRHPDVVIPGNLFDDISRRDLTMNAIAKDVSTGEIIDYYNGIKDIEIGNINCVGKMVDRFKEDSLRILRVLRFYTQFHSYEFKLSNVLNNFLNGIFDFDFETFDYIINNLKNLPIERKYEEMYKMFKIDTKFSIELINSIKWKNRNFYDIIFNDKMWLKPTLEQK